MGKRNPHTHKAVMASAELLKGTPYELCYVSYPKPTTPKYVFQHTVALSPGEAAGVIADAYLRLNQGTAEWSSGTPFVWPKEKKDAYVQQVRSYL